MFEKNKSLYENHYLWVICSLQQIVSKLMLDFYFTLGIISLKMVVWIQCDMSRTNYFMKGLQEST